MMTEALDSRLTNPFVGPLNQGAFDSPQIVCWQKPGRELKPTSVSPRATKVERGQIEPIEIDDADLAIFDSDDFEALPPIASYNAVLEFEGKVTPGGFAPVDDDELLWDALDFNAIGLGQPSQTRELTATVGEIEKGKPRSVAMDELDWELLDFD